MSVLSAVYGCAAKGVVRVVFIEPVVFVQNGNAGGFYGGNITEGVPHNLEMVVHFSAAAHIETLGDVFIAVAAAAGKLKLFKNVNVFAFHLSVAHKVERRSQTGEAGSDNISGFFINTLGFLRVCEGFISSCRIIHN